MEYAQSVPGQNQGRPAGLIEAGGAVDAAEASVLLAGSSAWSTTDEEALRHWCSQFLDWLLTSKLGKAEGAATNNHGTLYDVRVCMLALKTGRTELARKILLDAGRKRIAAQIESDGSQPHELSRTKSLSYSRLNLDGLTSLARLSGLVGVDLWRFTTTDGRSLKRAIDFLYPFAADPSLKWPHRQIAKFDRIELAGILRRAALAYDEPRYETLLSEIPGVAQLRLQLTIPRHAR